MMRKGLVILLDLILVGFVLSLTGSAVLQRLSGAAWGWVGISGTSMSPTLSHGALVLSLPARPESLRVGDIVVFYSHSVPPIVCHRIVGQGPDGWLTQGDASERLDQASGLPPINETTLAGVVPQIAGRPVAIPALGMLASGGGDQAGSHFALALALCFGFLALGRTPGQAGGRRRRRPD